jgi:hypothetical protein
MNPINITPNNSPYIVQGGTQNFDQVNFQGGYMILSQNTVLNMNTVNVQ